MTSSSWGRWGHEDERGAANLITSDITLAALATARTGEVLSLGLPLEHNHAPIVAHRNSMQHFMTRDGGDYAAGLKENGGLGFSEDVIMLPTHGGTHIDALAHVWHDHEMYNSFSADTVTSRGAIHCGVDKIGPLVTRALFVDLVPDNRVALTPDTAITADDIEACFSAANLSPQSGDALLLRTGWLELWRQGIAVGSDCPGLSPSAASWIVENGFAVVGADNIAVEITPSPDGGGFLPLHVELIRNHGIYFMELLNLESLRGRKCGAGLLVVSPLPIVNGVGSPVAPVLVL
jgi:kynurenine formamidase